MNKINIAIIGFGFMGKVYSSAAKTLNDYYPDIPEIEISSILVSKINQKRKRKHKKGMDLV